MDPHQHREGGIRLPRHRSEHIHVERRLARDRGFGDERHAGVAALSGRAELERVAHPLPRFHRHRSREAKLTDRRLRERDAQERGAARL